jgi:hypothetical protein
MVFRGNDEMHLQSFDDRGNSSRRWAEGEKFRKPSFSQEQFEAVFQSTIVDRIGKSIMLPA